MNEIEFTVGSGCVHDVTPPPATSRACGGGPGDGPAAIRVGFAAEPVVGLAAPHTAFLYSECLARVRSIDGTVHGAGRFVDYLELVRAIDLLDIAMVDMVTQTLVDHPDLRLGCNLSALTVGDVAAWSKILGAISSRGDIAARLTLEVTETQALNSKSHLVDHLAAARSLGCRLAIDDFGVGFSQQAYLQEVDIRWDVIKLDRSCFTGELADGSVRERLRSTIRQASAFADIVVVEGIETPLHLEIARSAGAEYGQGWLFAAPFPIQWSNTSPALLHYLPFALDSSRNLATAGHPVSSQISDRNSGDGVFSLVAGPASTGLRAAQYQG